LSYGYFDNCNFAYADFSDVASLSNARFSNVDFTNVIGLKLEPINNSSFENKCLISNDTFKNNSPFFKNLQFNKDYILEIQNNIKLPLEFKEILDKERIDFSNFPPNWPDNNVSKWQNDSMWANNENAKNKVCFLQPDCNLAKFISYLTHLTSDSVSYAACKLEDARLKKALKEGIFEGFQFCRQELFGTGPPSHEGRASSIVIKKVS